MRVFVTGASGWVGSVVTQELLRHGHSVLGLARSDASAAAIEAAGAQALRGDVEDVDSLIRGAQAADGVIHTAFIHDFSKFVENCEIDRRAITAMAGVLAHTGKPFVVTSGTGITAGVPGASETMRTADARTTLPRIASEQAAEAAAASGVNVSVVRLPPSVHGAGDHGFVPMLIQAARDKGKSAYIGEGENVWPGVHRLDAAQVFRLALERNASDARYHAAENAGTRFRDIAAAIGKGLNLPVVSLTPEEAADHFGWFSHFTRLDNPTSSQWTRETLGWAPSQPDLLADLDGDAYFR
ncbi:SDR family oxidoreductase [Asticcacaulis sp. EMRT-3]|uniref:SDR family oxidoreductase n=1 Tax=Asticcacaulis sp. EMRT-3 TaxID=3040349 RepID=UPI0024AF3EA0|nr:SDR family oxidoreductase [Asticcacaulis sp. EMRT-3]MDI7776164.1 SDR family oxidoreductase [Asticcacaulis sp. EMRT-3]